MKDLDEKIAAGEPLTQQAMDAMQRYHEAATSTAAVVTKLKKTVLRAICHSPTQLVYQSNEEANNRSVCARFAFRVCDQESKC